MKTSTKVILGVIGAVLVIIGLVSFTGSNASLGGTVENFPSWYTNGIKIGASNKLISNLTFGTCTLTGASTLAVGTSSALKMSCTATGVKSGDNVRVQLASTAPAAWSVIGASASTTNGFLEVTINNQSATTTIPSTVTAGLQYSAFR